MFTGGPPHHNDSDDHHHDHDDEDFDDHQDDHDDNDFHSISIRLVEFVYISPRETWWRTNVEEHPDGQVLLGFKIYDEDDNDDNNDDPHGEEHPGGQV